MIVIKPDFQISKKELKFSAIRAQGAGGQNVNKVASAIQLRFDIKNSNLPEQLKKNLLARHDHRITDDGILIIKAQNYRTQEKNREEALRRLVNLLRQAGQQRKKRNATKPTRASQRKRVESKVQKGRIKRLRKKVSSFGYA